MITGEPINSITKLAYWAIQIIKISFNGFYKSDPEPGPEASDLELGLKPCSD